MPEPGFLCQRATRRGHRPARAIPLSRNWENFSIIVEVTPDGSRTTAEGRVDDDVLRMTVAGGNVDSRISPGCDVCVTTDNVHRGRISVTKKARPSTCDRREFGKEENYHMPMIFISAHTTKKESCTWLTLPGLGVGDVNFDIHCLRFL